MITLTLYRGARSARPYRSDDFGDFGELADALEDLAQVEAAEKVDLFAIGPYRLRPKSTRADRNVEAVTLLALDVDCCDADALAERLEDLDVPAILYGSPSDNEDLTDARRVRVLAEIDRELSPDECKPARLAFAEALALEPGCGVEGALDPSRIFFCGRLEGTPPRAFMRFGGV